MTGKGEKGKLVPSSDKDMSTGERRYGFAVNVKETEGSADNYMFHCVIEKSGTVLCTAGGNGATTFVHKDQFPFSK